MLQFAGKSSLDEGPNRPLTPEVDVSVVIPTYNRSALVVEALRSVLRQTVRVREIVVVNDGSTDDTLERLGEFGDQIQVISQNNKGVSAARNRGIREARGSWIAFLDDDDVWVEDKIQLQFDIAQKQPEVGLIFCSFYLVDNNSDDPKIVAVPHDFRGYVFPKLLIKHVICTPAVLARKDVLEQMGGFDESRKIAEDRELWLRIAACYPVDFVPTPLVYVRYRVTGRLSTDTPIGQRQRDIEAVIEKSFSLQHIPLFSRLRLRHKAKYDVAWEWLVAGHKGRAFRESLAAIGYWPLSWIGYRMAISSILPESLKARIKRVIRKNSGF